LTYITAQCIRLPCLLKIWLPVVETAGAVILADGESLRLRNHPEGGASFSGGHIELEATGCCIRSAPAGADGDLIDSEWKEADTGRERKYYFLSSMDAKRLKPNASNGWPFTTSLSKLWKINRFDLRTALKAGGRNWPRSRTRVRRPGANWKHTCADAIAELCKRGLNEEESFWLARRRVGHRQPVGGSC